LLYTSAWFKKVRDFVEASGARWFILFACYGASDLTNPRGKPVLGHSGDRDDVS
jgi:Family of unknown function (DUF6884)